MEINLLSSYLSRGQIREYLGYILENGTGEIVESPDTVYATEPIPIRIGSSISSIKVFHVVNGIKDKVWLTQVGLNFSDNDEKPSLPADASYVGLFYMSKYGRDYSGDPDVIAGEKVQGDIGDVLWFDVKDWDRSTFSKSSEGANYRLFVFWNAAPLQVISE